jgi:hypothetical protein
VLGLVLFFLCLDPLCFFFDGLALELFGARELDFFSDPPGVTAGGAWVEVLLVVLVVEELELEAELEVVVLVGVVVDPEEHTSLTDRTWRVAGTSEEIGTPIGTLKVSPPAVVTCSSQLDAEPVGVQAPRPATTVAARPTRSLGLLNTVASLLPRFDCLKPSNRDKRAR